MKATIIAIIAVFPICGLDAYDPFYNVERHGRYQDHHREVEMQTQIDRLNQHIRESHGLERDPFRVLSQR